MTIEEQIEYLEEQTKELIDQLTPKDKLTYLTNIKEFTRAKIQRSTFEPVGANETEIIIKYAPNRVDTHENFPKSLDEPKKD
jgi:hypothetical protein